jgi:hypothetical protein
LLSSLSSLLSIPSLFLPLPCGVAVADCVPPNCVTAPCPELAKAWLLRQCSWPLSTSANPHCPYHSYLHRVGWLLLIACHQPVLPPLARSLQKPGSLGNTVGHLSLPSLLLPPPCGAAVVDRENGVGFANELSTIWLPPIFLSRVGALRSVAQRRATMGTGVRATMGTAANQRCATMGTVPIVAGVHTDRAE